MEHAAYLFGTGLGIVLMVMLAAIAVGLVVLGAYAIGKGFWALFRRVQRL